MQYQSFLENVLQEASSIALKKFGHVVATTKISDSNQVVTEADIAVGTFIISQIKEIYPTHNIIDEEAGVVDNGSEYTWVIDPIDGTSNFSAGLDTFGIMLGLLQGNTPIAGGISLPIHHEIYTAEKGNGTYCNKQKLHVTSETNLLNVLISYGIDGHRDHPEITRQECALLAEILLEIRNLRTTNSSYDITLVAKGIYGAWLTRGSKIWDNVAPQIIIQEAGGIYTDFFGKPIDYTHPLQKRQTNFTVCGASPQLHKKLQEIIHAHPRA